MRLVALFAVAVVGSGLAQNQPVECPSPTIKYPPLAQHARIGGVVSVVVETGAAGEVKSVKADGHALQAPAVEKALKEWKLVAERADSTIKLEVRFELTGGPPCGCGPSSPPCVTKCTIQSESVILVQTGPVCVQP